MKPRTLRSDGLLLLTAAIWGFAFVAQRAGMEHVGPFTFNAIRFGIGSLVLLPFVLRDRARRARMSPGPSASGALRGSGERHGPGDRRPLPGSISRGLLTSGLLAGVILFAGATLQQTGLVYTTAGKAGFITGLYVILVPLLGLLWAHRPGLGGWLGAALAVIGLGLLSLNEHGSISRGDALVLAGAFAWAAHVLVISRLSPTLPSTTLASFQFAICAGLSLLAALVTEQATRAGIGGAMVPILYSGLLSVGIAYTLQVVAQRDAPPTHAAIIMSLEAVFAAIGGWVLLHESFSPRDLFGCGLMLAGMVVSQIGRRDPELPGLVSAPRHAAGARGGERDTM
jgi:drug/metabolite transporter (DMT)-like permease